MRWFRRSKGRHALGAAVTALPSGPAAVTWTSPPWDARTTPVVPAPVVPAPVSVGTVLTVPTSPTSQSVPASDALRAERVAAQATPSEVAVVGSRDELFDSIAALIASGEAWSQPPVAPLVVPVQVVPAVVPVQAAPVQAAPVQTSPVQTSAAQPHGSRVSIGFRDGTTAVLARDSEQAAALEELAALLSLRD